MILSRTACVLHLPECCKLHVPATLHTACVCMCPRLNGYNPPPQTHTHTHTPWAVHKGAAHRQYVVGTHLWVSES